MLAGRTSCSAACCAAAAVCALVCVQHGAGGIRRTPPRLCPTQGARPTRTVANGPPYAETASTQCAQGAKINGPRGVAQRQPQPTAARALAQTKHKSCTPGRSRALAMAPTLPCPHVGVPSEHPRALQARSLPPFSPPLPLGSQRLACALPCGAFGASRGGRAEEGTPPPLRAARPRHQPPCTPSAGPP